MRKRKQQKSGNLFFRISMLVALLLILTPLFMRCSIISKGVSIILEPLKVIDYKSTYIEMLGAMIGSFVAITGALWVQNIKNDLDRRNTIKESALIVYYDFEFSLKELHDFLQAYACISHRTDDAVNHLEYFNRYKRSIHNMYLDAEWIRNVARLQGSMDEKAIKQIYNLYGVLNTIIKILDMDDKEIDMRVANKVYILLQTEIFKLTLKPKIEVNLKAENSLLLEQLKSLMK